VLLYRLLYIVPIDFSMPIRILDVAGLRGVAASRYSFFCVIAQIALRSLAPKPISIMVFTFAKDWYHTVPIIGVFHDERMLCCPLAQQDPYQESALPSS
jgi:hypothetical protein